MISKNIKDQFPILNNKKKEKKLIYLYSANSSQKQNTNPCAKPISLYSYLINLFTFPHDLVLDPYCGSGTTPIACVLTNRKYIGLELEKEYFDIFAPALTGKFI